MPGQAARRDLASGNLVKISAPDAEIRIDIGLYRSIERSRPELERFWPLATGGGA